MASPLLRLLVGVVAIAQASAAPKIVLRYFDIRGLAEPIRLTLAALDLEYEEVVYDRCGDQCPDGIQDWGQAKAAGTESGLFPFGQVPSVTYTDDDGHTFDLVQSHAILRFLGRRHQFYGTSEHEEILIDIAMGGVGDMRAKYSKLAYDPAVQTNPSLLEEYKAKYLPLWLGHFQRLLLKAGHEYFGGSAFSVADLLVFDILDHNLRVDPKCLDAFPTLDAFHINIGHKHGVWQHLQTRRTWANGRNAAYDTPDSPPAGTGHIGPEKTGLKPDL